MYPTVDWKVFAAIGASITCIILAAKVKPEDAPSVLTEIVSASTNRDYAIANSNR